MVRKRGLTVEFNAVEVVHLVDVVVGGKSLGCYTGLDL